MATVRVLRVLAAASIASPERMTRRPKELGPHYRLCPRCKGPGMVAEVKCERCDGKGMVLE